MWQNDRTKGLVGIQNDEEHQLAERVGSLRMSLRIMVFHSTTLVSSITNPISALLVTLTDGIDQCTGSSRPTAPYLFTYSHIFPVFQDLAPIHGNIDHESYHQRLEVKHSRRACRPIWLHCVRTDSPAFDPKIPKTDLIMMMKVAPKPRSLLELLTSPIPSD